MQEEEEGRSYLLLSARDERATRVVCLHVAHMMKNDAASLFMLIVLQDVRPMVAAKRAMIVNKVGETDISKVLQVV